MSLYEKHFDNNLFSWSIFTKKQSDFVTWLNYYAIPFEWGDDWWDDKLGDKLTISRVSFLTLLFFIWMPVTILFMIIFAISGISFLIYNKWNKLECEI